MTRHRTRSLAVASLMFGLLGPLPALAASVTMVNRSTWGAAGVPDYVTMYIYVPDQLADNPPVLVACHSCGTPVSGYVNSITGIRAAADSHGFIIILPEATGRNCWDVGTPQSLSHDGGGDTQAIAQMVQYTLGEYDGDASRVYVMGGSSGAMMTQALLAVYPDMFRAGSARAGVPAGCWADGFDPSNQWSGNCANGMTTKTAQAWGDQVRAMFPSFTGHRPRVQIFHGTADTTIRYPNFAEAIKEWTNVLGLSETPTSADTTTTPVSTYERQFWQNECSYTVFEAWAGQNGSHSMAYEEEAILEFFGLDAEGGADPEPACPVAGTGGTSGAGGGAGAGASGMGGAHDSGGAAGSSGAAGSGATSGNGGIAGSGALAGAGGTGGAGGSGGTFGGSGPVTNPPAGGSSGMGAAGLSSGGGAGVTSNAGSGGTAASTGGSMSETAPAEDAGCGCVVAGRSPANHAHAALVAGLAWIALRRRRPR